MRSFYRRRGIPCFGRRVSETSTIACVEDDINEVSLRTPTGSGASLFLETKNKSSYLSRGSTLLGLIGVLMILTAYLIYAMDPYNIIINHTLALYEGSYAYSLWKKPPVPVYLRVYVFNVTNSEAFLRGDERLKVEELGPYVYREVLENANATFGTGEDDSVTFDPKRTVHWEADMSRGSLQDRIIAPNIPLIGLSSMLSKSSVWTTMAFSALTNYLSSKPFLELSVEEYLWGHKEPLLELASKVLPSWIPFSSLGLLDRLFDMGSGNITINDGRTNYKNRYLIQKVNDADTLGRWSWKDSPEPQEINFYEACRRRDTVNGTYEGLMFPQGIERNMSFRMYRDAFCRSIQLTYTKDVVVRNMFSAFRYQPPYGVLNNSDSENACLCVNDEENCLPSGLSDVSPCFFSIPTAVSFPHHYQSDPKLREEVQGLFPIKEKHETYMDIQPIIGVPLEAHSRIQLNLVVHNTKRIRKAAPFSNLILPIFWTDLSCRSNSGNSAARLLIESRKREELNRKHEEMQKSALMQKAKNKFEEIMERKYMRNTIKNEAVSGRRAASLNLEQRRERLRTLLEEEEMGYKMEVHDRLIKAERDAYAEKICRAKSIEMEREYERNRIVEEKRLQQFMNNYEPVRKMIMKKNHEKTFSAQLEQLRENEERHKSELEEKYFWKEVDMKRLEKQRQKEEAVLQEAKRKVVDSQLTLNKQIEEKERQKAEEAASKVAELKQLEKIKEKERLDEMELLKKKADERNRMQKLLKEQIYEREVSIMKQNEYEKSFDDKLNKTANEETLKQRELKKIFLDEAQKDIYRFKEHIDKLRQERLKEDKRYEELVESQRKYLDKLRDEKELLKREAQKKLEKEVLAERNMQLQMKEQKNMMEKEMRALEAQMTEKIRLENLQAEKELAQKNSLTKSKYAADLKQQMELMQQIKEKEKEEADRMLQHEILAEKDYLGKAKEILNTKPDNGIHPFRVIIPDFKS